MKTTAVVESLSTIQPDVLFQRLPAYFKIQSTEWEIYIKTIAILGIYHCPPKQDQANTTFLVEITKLLTSKLPNMENAIILVDFNMPIEDPTDNNSKLFVDMTKALGLWQHVNEPTHQRGNILDLIFTKSHPK